MTTLLTAFNILVLQFNDDLIKTFPEENDFKVSKNAILLLKRTNPRKLLELFKEHFDAYREPISIRDERFFLTNDYRNLDVTNSFMLLVDKLKRLWARLDNDNKTKIWNYFDTFFKLIDKF